MKSGITIVGAGIAGVSAAFELAVRRGVRSITLIDEREPLTLTSDKGTQGYRNWWPGPDDTMLRYVSRSIDLLEERAHECGNTFRLNRRGYLFVTADDTGLANMRSNASLVSSFGMGPVREGIATYQPARAEGFADQPDGADLLLGDDARRAFPFLAANTLAPNTLAALHVRRAGWLNAVALGDSLLKRAVAAGVRVVRDRVTHMDAPGGRISRVKLASGTSLETGTVLLTAGPALPHVARMLDIELPLYHELHAKVTFSDPQRIIPRDAPFTIWIDPVTLTFGDGTSEPFPGGVHVRPVDGPRGDELYLIWTYHTSPVPYVWPPQHDARYGDICLRGLAVMVPGMASYLAERDRGFVDGGYYCKTSDNRPLIGPLPVEGVFVFGGLSGTGIMSSQAGAELVGAHVTGAGLPSYARAFLPSRYDDVSYLEQVERWGALTGQL